MNYVKIKGEDYPVIYSVQAMFWFADWLGVPTSELPAIFEDGMTERKGLALMYSGLVAGAEQERKRLDLSFYEFQEYLMFDASAEKVQDTLGTLFKKQFEVLATKLQSKVASSAKKKPARKVEPASD